MLLLVAVMSLVLGMGLPTTANYIVVSSLMAPVVVMVGAQNGLIVPLVAVHLFVFYFGILADDTPPVGLAAFAAAAISRGDPIRTGIQGFSYDIRTAVLPFMFIFNTDILLIDVGVVDGLVAVIVTTVGMLAFCSATQRFMLIRNRLWETLLLLLIAFTMFRPDFWLDRWSPPFDLRPGPEIVALLEADAGATSPRDLRVRFVGPDFDEASRLITRNSIIQVSPTEDAFAGLADAGVVMTLDEGRGWWRNRSPAPRCSRNYRGLTSMRTSQSRWTRCLSRWKAGRRGNGSIFPPPVCWGLYGCCSDGDEAL
jgi:hypothetical protein